MLAVILQPANLNRPKLHVMTVCGVLKQTNAMETAAVFRQPPEVVLKTISLE